MYGYGNPYLGAFGGSLPGGIGLGALGGVAGPGVPGAPSAAPQLPLAQRQPSQPFSPLLPGANLPQSGISPNILQSLLGGQQGGGTFGGYGGLLQALLGGGNGAAQNVPNGLAGRYGP